MRPGWIGRLLFAFLVIVVLIVYKLLSIDIPQGWTSLIVIVLFLGGIQLFSIGLLGEYVGRIYMSINKTPQYVIKSSPGTAASPGTKQESSASAE